MAKKFLSPLNLLNLTSDPGTAAEGDFYWNSSTNKLRIYFDGAWSNIDALPSQTGNSGEFLVTNGTSASWSNTIAANAANTQALIVKGITSQSADIQQWQDSGGTTQGYVVAGGNQIYFPGIFASYNMQANSGGAAVVPLIVKGFASQSANLQQWQNSAGSVLSYVRSDGGIYAISASDNRLYNLGIGGSSNGISWLYVTPQNANEKPVVVRGAGSQSVNLTEWQNSLGTVLASVNQSGNITAAQFIRTSGTSSQFLKADGSVDSSTYLTTASASSTYQPLDADLTAIAGLAGTSGFLKKTAADSWSLDTSTYLTANQSITLSGDVTGSGTTAITTTLANSGVVAGTYNDSSVAVRPFTVDAKGRITSIGTAVTITPDWSNIASKPTTLSGFGITDALSNSATSTQSGYFGDIYLYDDATPSHYLQISNSTNLTVNRLLNINVNDANRTISLSGDLTVSSSATVSGTNTGDQTITLTGDVTGSGTGSFSTTLANSGATAGTYKSVTVDVKGRVTAGTNPTTLSGYGITDALSNSTTSTQAGYFGDIYLYDDSTPSHYLQITNSANLTAARLLNINTNDADRTISLSGNLTVSSAATVSGTNTGDQTITLTGDVTGSGTGSFATTLANSGVTAGTYKSVTVDVKGRVTGGTNPTTLSGYGITDALDTSATAQTKSGNLTAAQFIRSGGTSSQFLKADGSVDSSTYLTTSTASSTYAPIASPTFTGTVTLPGAPTSALHAATKQYVDDVTSGLNFHAAVKYATTGALGTTGNLVGGTITTTYNNGTSGVGATLTIATSSNWTDILIDGQSLTAGDRILIKDQAAGLQNGIYTVTTLGSIGNTTSFVFTRATDADNSPSGEMATGDFTFVQTGTTNGGFGYINNTSGAITIGTTAISYAIFNTGQSVIAGDGLTESTPGTLAVNATVVRTSGSYSNPSWITSLAWSKLSTTPTTLAGYGITDAIDTSATAQTKSGTLTAASFIPTSSTAPTNGMFLPAANTIGFSTNSGEKVRIDSNGALSINAGANTTYADLNVWKSGQANIDLVNTNFKLAAGGRSGGRITFRVGGNTAERGDIAAAIEGYDEYAGGSYQGSLRFYTNTAAALTEKMRIDQSGNVGIGTSSPWSLLSINGSTNISSGTSTVSQYPIVIHRPSGSNGHQTGIAFSLFLDTTNPSTYTPGAAINFERVGANSQGDMVFKTKPTIGATDSIQERMRIGYTGSVSINSTSYTLGSGSVAHQLGIIPGAAANVGLVVRSIASQTADLQQWQDSSGTNLVRINPTGQISTSNVIVVGTLSGSIAQASIYTTSPTGIGIAVRGSASQTADLQQWQNNSGTAVATMSAAGAFTAITKSFDIPHPTKENMRLRYGSLEGPENGVYVRGRSKQDYIALPDHWRGLVDEDTITVNITPVGKKQDIYVDSIEDNRVYLGGKIKEYFFTVYGERKDVDKLIVEY